MEWRMFMKRKIIPLLVLGLLLPLLVTQVDAAIFPSVTGTVKDPSGAYLQSVKVTMYYKGVKQDYDYTSSTGFYSVRINEPISKEGGSHEKVLIFPIDWTVVWVCCPEPKTRC